MLSRGISSADGIGPAIQIVGNVLQGDRGCFRHPESVLAVPQESTAFFRTTLPRFFLAWR